MTDIPDDVVERACDEYAKARYGGQYKWPDDFLSEDQDKVRDDMRAAGRIFVEWERERAVKAFTEAAKEKGEWPNVIDYYTAAIRARGE